MILSRFFSQGALINTKLRNRLTKPTFEKIIRLKIWGIFRNEEEEVKEKEEMLKKEEKNKEDKDIKDISEQLYFYIPEIEQFYSLLYLLCILVIK